jgi:Fur family ferric uptake transcriptional regulator
LQANSRDLERAAQTAIEALRALGYKGLSMDVAVRGVCLDCATGNAGAPE